MEIYFNDIPLQGEFFLKYFLDEREIPKAIKNFKAFCENIKNLKKEFRLQNSVKFYSSKAILIQFHSFLGNREYQKNFINWLGKANIKFWDETGKQRDNHQYYFFDVTEIPPVSHDIKGSTVAEAAERMVLYAGNPVLALNLPEIPVCNQQSLLVHRIDYYKQVTALFISCTDTEDGIKEWMQCHIGIEKIKYNPLSTDPPTDLQTCLRNTLLFEKTKKIVQGRAVYREKATKRLWYVDNSNYHTGGSAHLEVFDPTGGKHLGKADLNGTIDFSKAVPGRSIQED